MRHSKAIRRISLKALGLTAAALILFGGMTNIRPAYAEEEDRDESSQEEVFDGEYVWDEYDDGTDDEYGPEDGE